MKCRRLSVPLSGSQFVVCVGEACQLTSVNTVSVTEASGGAVSALRYSDRECGAVFGIVELFIVCHLNSQGCSCVDRETIRKRAERHRGVVQPVAFGICVDLYCVCAVTCSCSYAFFICRDVSSFKYCDCRHN